MDSLDQQLRQLTQERERTCLFLSPAGVDIPATGALLRRATAPPLAQAFVTDMARTLTQALDIASGALDDTDELPSPHRYVSIRRAAGHPIGHTDRSSRLLGAVLIPLVLAGPGGTGPSRAVADLSATDGADVLEAAEIALISTGWRELPVDELPDVEPALEQGRACRVTVTQSPDPDLVGSPEQACRALDAALEAYSRADRLAALVTYRCRTAGTQAPTGVADLLREHARIPGSAALEATRRMRNLTHEDLVAEPVPRSTTLTPQMLDQVIQETDPSAEPARKRSSDLRERQK